MIKDTIVDGAHNAPHRSLYNALGLTKEESRHVSVPTVAEAPIAIECRVREVLPMGSHDVFVADILAVNVADEFVDESGKIRMDKAGLVAYAHGEYFALGRRLGKFGFAATKKKKPHKNPSQNTRERK